MEAKKAPKLVRFVVVRRAALGNGELCTHRDNMKITKGHVITCVRLHRRLMAVF